METTAVNNATTVEQTSGKQSLALDSEDFMQLMITELTNQDPFEPIKNQDLLNQMSAIQQLQSNQDMSQSFQDLMERYDSLLARQEFGTAAQMIGQLISGNTSSGQYAVGKVVAVRLEENNLLLELDTGQTIDIKNLDRLGGSSGQDIVGQMVLGTDTSGARVVGKAVSVEVNGEQVMLHLHRAGDPEAETVEVPLAGASIINRDTADLLIGYTARSGDGRQGVIQSVEWVEQEGQVDVMINLLASDNTTYRLPLEEITGIY